VLIEIRKLLTDQIALITNKNQRIFVCHRSIHGEQLEIQPLSQNKRKRHQSSIIIDAKMDMEAEELHNEKSVLYLKEILSHR
jgi:hypothetical protein